ncbi:pollen-specific leucine-rich repeat extensin-like protein 1 [Kryptolebias marmoratus]|uniref:pollen-specific leucine-rich repeat extensin-like protein 1 n=1 Tax=Kryptolebias marmoratus TaxID=37003 RepID=UPI0007F9301B|nr:pollen-specific leucine-rich repeat extensin-like protein 1 [Kryptolebias marmoratus]
MTQPLHSSSYNPLWHTQPARPKPPRWCDQQGRRTGSPPSYPVHAGNPRLPMKQHMSQHQPGTHIRAHPPIQTKYKPPSTLRNHKVHTTTPPARQRPQTSPRPWARAAGRSSRGRPDMRSKDCAPHQSHTIDPEMPKHIGRTPSTHTAPPTANATPSRPASPLPKQSHTPNHCCTLPDSSTAPRPKSWPPQPEGMNQKPKQSQESQSNDTHPRPSWPQAHPQPRPQLGGPLLPTAVNPKRESNNAPPLSETHQGRWPRTGTEPQEPTRARDCTHAPLGRPDPQTRPPVQHPTPGPKKPLDSNKTTSRERPHSHRQCTTATRSAPSPQRRNQQAHPVRHPPQEYTMQVGCTLNMPRQPRTHGAEPPARQPPTRHTAPSTAHPTAPTPSQAPDHSHSQTSRTMTYTPWRHQRSQQVPPDPKLRANPNEGTQPAQAHTLPCKQTRDHHVARGPASPQRITTPIIPLREDADTTNHGAPPITTTQIGHRRGTPNPGHGPPARDYPTSKPTPALHGAGKDSATTGPSNASSPHPHTKARAAPHKTTTTTVMQTRARRDKGPQNKSPCC